MSVRSDEILKLRELQGIWYLEDYDEHLLGRFNTRQEAVDFCLEMGYSWRER